MQLTGTELMLADAPRHGVGLSNCAQPERLLDASCLPLYRRLSTPRALKSFP